MHGRYYADIKKAGFHSLSYFDIGNWGTRTNTSYKGPNITCGTRPNGMPPCTAVHLFKCPRHSSFNEAPPCTFSNALATVILMK